MGRQVGEMEGLERFWEVGEEGWLKWEGINEKRRGPASIFSIFWALALDHTFSVLEHPCILVL